MFLVLFTFIANKHMGGSKDEVCQNKFGYLNWDLQSLSSCHLSSYLYLAFESLHNYVYWCFVLYFVVLSFVVIMCINVVFVLFMSREA